MNDKKPSPVRFDDQDLIHMARGAGAKLPEGFIDQVMGKAKAIDKERAKERAKKKEKGRDMLDD